MVVSELAVVSWFESLTSISEMSSLVVGAFLANQIIRGILKVENIEMLLPMDYHLWWVKFKYFVNNQKTKWSSNLIEYGKKN